MMSNIYMGLLVLGILGNLIYSVITRINHISHIDERLKELSEKIDNIAKESALHGERLARMEGKVYNGDSKR